MKSVNFSEKSPGVAELQGLYGPLQVLEGKVQQVWALQQMQRGDWRTRRGAALTVKFPGRWNRGPGPDFKEAVLEMDGHTVIGDIELHLYREDWWRHGHDLDPAFDAVILHVVLFAGGMEREVCTFAGRRPEEWIMGPWMREDLESVAGGEPGLFGELVPELREWMEADDPAAVRQRLQIGADRRWEDKVSMARCLLESAGWDGGLHRMVLFYLGFPFNRRPFFAMAEAYPREAWTTGDLLSVLRERWAEPVRWGIGRPANRAETRLREYIRLNTSVPDWTSRLETPPTPVDNPVAGPAYETASPEETRKVRKALKFRELSKWLGDDVLGDVLNKSLQNRLWVDVFLPMLAAADRLPPAQAAVLWFHAEASSFPEAYGDMFRIAGIRSGEGYPLCNGWVQGLLWAEDQLRLERIRRSLGNGPVPKPGLTS